MAKDSMANVIAGLEILHRYGGTMVDAQHDILYAMQGDDTALSVEDAQAMIDHGWRLGGEQCRGCGDEDLQEAVFNSTPDGDGDPSIHLLTCQAWYTYT